MASSGSSRAKREPRLTVAVGTTLTPSSVRRGGDVLPRVPQVSSSRSQAPLPEQLGDDEPAPRPRWVTVLVSLLALGVAFALGLVPAGTWSEVSFGVEVDCTASAPVPVVVTLEVGGEQHVDVALAEEGRAVSDLYQARCTPQR